MQGVGCVKISRSTVIERTPRVMQLEGLFEIPPSATSEVSWDVRLPIDDAPWNIGLIVGPSGCGKSTIAKELFTLTDSFEWPENKSIVDAFPKSMGIKEITGLLSSVGFSSPPSWLRPFHVLSNGEQFRVTIARAMAESDTVVIDEFSSVVDRTVAQIGSAAISKSIRRQNRKFVAIACHYDIIDWLQPDWIYEPATGTFSRRSLRQRPEITLTVTRRPKTDWAIFKKHHYLATSLSPTAKCFVAEIGGSPAAFVAAMSFPHATRPGWREHRTVCLPDFQGAGIGNAMSEYVASLFRATGKPYYSVTSNPAMVRHRAKSKLWNMKRKMSICSSRGTEKQGPGSRERFTASFEYVGQANVHDAKEFGVI